jgi:iron-sulfur cluster repair protein YtfE (RIC family)
VSATYDMTLMYAMHDALRRELEHIARITARTGDDPRRILAAASGWEFFKQNLHVHHTAEDEALWPAMRLGLAERPSELALVQAMEDEHGEIDPLIEAVDAALADRGSGPERLGDLTDALAAAVTRHLKHEEDEALPLIDSVVTQEQWQHFGMVHGSKNGDPSLAMPWLLDGADEEMTAKALAILPEPLRAAYRDEWLPKYTAWDRWGTAGAE